MKTTFVKYYLLIGILLNTKRERKTIDSDSKWDSQERQDQGM